MSKDRSDRSSWFSRRKPADEDLALASTDSFAEATGEQVNAARTRENIPDEMDRRSRAPLPRPGGSDDDKDKPRTRKRWWFSPRFWLILIVLLALDFAAVRIIAPGQPDVVSIPYSPVFLDQVRANNVDRISSQESTIEGIFKKPVRYPKSDKDIEPRKNFTTEVPTFANTDALSRILQEHKVTIEAESVNEGRSVFLSLLLGFGPVLLIVGLFVFLARKAGGQMGALGAFSRSSARRVESSQQKITFADVAGIEEAKAELTEIVDFLKNPDRYRRLGGRIPRGVLLSGRPGTGKTLLARAISGEADVPFFSISASEFVEAIVGIGASRVRDLFRQAKDSSPAIIFIDELDAIGRQRTSSANFGGGSDEREQTLNQILTEMDGFESDAAVIVLGATNRSEILDPALLRPGRFDRRVVVPSPDKDGRYKILLVHTRSVPLNEDVNLDRIAATTPGMVGADLANLVNEAALLAARRLHDSVHMKDLTDALEKIILGTPRSMVISEKDRRRTAYHEAGHAIVGMLTPGADPVRKVSIIPRGMALGVTFASPDEDRTNFEETWLRSKIKVALGGRAAEELIYNTYTSGAESDIQQLTEIARHMVGRWGMSEAIGPVAVLPSDAAGPLLPGVSETSETTHRLIDEEVRRIVEKCYAEVMILLKTNMDRLNSLTNALLEHETLDQDDAYQAAGFDRAEKAAEEKSGTNGVTP